INARKGRREQAFALLNMSGCNIGNFGLPFAQSFLGPVGVMAVSLFDVGNAFICLGGAFSIASMVQEGNQKFAFGRLFKALGKSVPLMTYIIMTILSALHLALPKAVVEFAGILGNANAGMAMLMIGVGFHLSGKKEQFFSIAKILTIRYSLGICLALLSWFFLPLPLEYRQALVLVFLTPIASAAPAFTAEIKNDYGLSSAINSASIIISIVLITGALLLIV
ncbi:MAG: AEC family transporter, partial [Clostridiales bacterium]|nr:AEC family transporter [Candidatus Blautia equi]